MNKLKVDLYVCIVVLTLITFGTFAAPPTEKELAEITLLTHFTKGQALSLQDKLAEHAEKVKVQSQIAPSELTNAAVFCSCPLTSRLSSTMLSEPGSVLTSP